MREREKEILPHGGLESMQYSRSWSCSIGGWVMSAIVMFVSDRGEKLRGKRRKEEETEEEEFRTK